RRERFAAKVALHRLWLVDLPVLDGQGPRLIVRKMQGQGQAVLARMTVGMDQAYVALLIGAEIRVGWHKLAARHSRDRWSQRPVEGRHERILAAVDLDRRLGQQVAASEESRVSAKIEVLLHLAVEHR